MDTALLVLRLVVGLGLAAHGAQKLYGWFGGKGLAGTGRWLEALGFRPGHTFALAAGLAEFVGGSLVAFGLFGPVGPALAIAVMVVAMISVHIERGFFATGNGVELPLLYATGAAAIGLAGHGAYSLDAELGLASAWSQELAMIAIAFGILAGLGAQLLGRHGLGAPHPKT